MKSLQFDPDMAKEYAVQSVVMYSENHPIARDLGAEISVTGSAWRLLE